MSEIAAAGVQPARPRRRLSRRGGRADAEHLRLRRQPDRLGDRCARREATPRAHARTTATSSKTSSRSGSSASTASRRSTSSAASAASCRSWSTPSELARFGLTIPRDRGALARARTSRSRRATSTRASGAMSCAPTGNLNTIEAIEGVVLRSEGRARPARSAGCGWATWPRSRSPTRSRRRGCAFAASRRWPSTSCANRAPT